MAEFDWNKYETQEPEFDWGKYENEKTLKATGVDKEEAFRRIKLQNPRMPDFVIKALMPIATRMAEAPRDETPGTAEGAMWRSAIRTPLEGAENLASLVGLPVNRNAQWPSIIAESESDKSHPFAQGIGGLAGFLAPGLGSVTALRSIPAWGNIVKNAAPSLLRTLPVMGAEGAALGAGFSAPGNRGEGALAGGALGAAGSAIPSLGRGLMSLKERISSLRNLDKLRSQGKITDSQYQKAISDEEVLMELSKLQGLGTDINKMQVELPELRQTAQQLRENINEIPEINTKNMLGSPTGEDLIPNAEKTLISEQKRLSQAEEQLANHLYRGYEHGVPIAESVVNEIEGIPVKGSNKRMGGVKKDIGNEYSAIENNLKDKNIVIPRSHSMKQIEVEARKSLDDSRAFFKNDAQYESAIKQIMEQMKPSSEGSDIMPAANVLSNYRSLRNMSQKLRSKAYSKEVAGNKDLQKDILSQADELEGNANNFEKIMEEHDLGGELENLKSTNKRWKNEVVPLYKNRIYQTFLNQGYSPTKDLIYGLRGSGPGQEIIRDIIKKNPSLIRSALGQRYANKPGNIHDFDELAQEFINAAPQETRNIIGSHRESLENIERAKSGLESAKKQAQKIKLESERVERSFKEEKVTQENRLKKEEELRDIQTKIADLERNIPELKKKSKAKDISLQKKMELDKKISKAEKDVAALKKQALYLGTGIVGYGIGSFGLGLKNRSGQANNY